MVFHLDRLPAWTQPMGGRPPGQTSKRPASRSQRENENAAGLILAVTLPLVRKGFHFRRKNLLFFGRRTAPAIGRHCHGEGGDVGQVVLGGVNMIRKERIRELLYSLCRTSPASVHSKPCH